MAVQIQLRRGTASQWTSTNPTLAAGEIALETDTRKLKLGDGSTAWTSLAYFSAGSGDITGVDITAGNGLDISQSGTTAGNYTATVSADLKSNGGLVIESTEIAVKLDASSITGTLAIADGGTGSTSAGDARTALGLGTAAVAATGTGDANVILGNDARLDNDRDPTNHSTAKLTSGTLPVVRGGTGATSVPMIGVITAANAGAAQGVLGGTTVGKAVFVAANAAAARSAIGAGSGNGDLVASNNLSDLANAGTARSNLGLGTAAVAATGTGDGNVILGNDARLDDDRDPTNHSTAKLTSGTLPVARGGTGVTSLAMVAIPAAANATAARAVLELGSAALVATGTGDANAILGNDARLTNDRDPNDHSAAKVTSGTLGVDRIPALASSKITSGTLGVDRIPALSADKITSGTLAVARIPALSTDKLTSGTLPVGRGGTGLTAVTTLLNSNTTKSDVGLGNVTNIVAQPVNADLTAIAGLTSAANKGIQFTGSGSAAVYTLTAAGKALLDDADAATQRQTLGLSTAAVLAVGTSANNVVQLSGLGAMPAVPGSALTGLNAGNFTSGTLAVARGGTGVTSLPMVTIPGAADAAAARVVLGVTNIGSYTGQIETAADKTYTLDPGSATARTITGFFIKSASGTVTAALKVGTAVVKSASVTSSTGDQSSLANTSVSANDVLTLVTSSNSSALDVIFSVEYTE